MPGRMPGGTLTPIRCMPGAGGVGACGDGPWPLELRALGEPGALAAAAADLRKKPMAKLEAVVTRGGCSKESERIVPRERENRPGSPCEGGKGQQTRHEHRHKRPHARTGFMHMCVQGMCIWRVALLVHAA